VIQSRQTFQRASTTGLPAAQVMTNFAAWAAPYTERGAKFVARPAAFDWPWIVQYAWKYLGHNPFGFNALCASSWFAATGRVFRVKLPHLAEQDAVIQLEYFLRGGRE
jgi:hypothetical protein